MTPQQLSLVHLVKEPTVLAASGKPPLLVLLHGFGSNEHDLFGLAPFLDPKFLIVSARGPITLGPSSFAWYRLQFTADDFIYDAKEAERAWDSVSRFRAEAVAAYHVDPERVFLMGFSQGAIMTLSAGLIEPEPVAGLVAMSGRLLPEAVERFAGKDRLAGLPVLVTHGVADSVIPIRHGRAIRRRLSDLPLDLTYREYPMAHQISDAALSDVSAWLSDVLERDPKIKLG